MALTYFLNLGKASPVYIRYALPAKKYFLKKSSS